MSTDGQQLKQHRTRSGAGKRAYFTQDVCNWLAAFLLSAGVLLFVFGIWLTPVRVTGHSMEPAFREGQVVLADRFATAVRLPGRGDAILFSDPLGTGYMIKRIVALPGETVEIRGGHVFIDGCPVSEDYISEDPAEPAGDMEAVTVPSGSVFVLGDNRSDVYDSRFSAIGCVRYGDILGVIRVRLDPLSVFN